MSVTPWWDRGISSRGEWLRQRELASRDPGAYHGEIARRAIFWFDRASGSWIRRRSEGPGWHCIDATTWTLSGESRLPDDHQPWSNAVSDRDAPFYRWFEGGWTNACFNEVDAHVLQGFGEEVAFIVEPEQREAQAFKISRKKLYWEVLKRASVLEAMGLRKGDRIAINMPNIPEAIYFVQAAKRLGLIYVFVSAGLSARTLAERLCDSGARILVTVDRIFRVSESTGFKESFADQAMECFAPVQEVSVALRSVLDGFGVSDGERESLLEALRQLTNGGLCVEKASAYESLTGRFERLALAGKDPAAVAGFSMQLREILDRIKLPVERVLVAAHAPGAEGPRKKWDAELGSLLDQATAGLLERLSRRTGKIIRSEAELQALSGEQLARGLGQFLAPIPVESDFPMFIMYTSGSTGRPKGLVHTHGGYISGLAHTMLIAFGVRPGDGQVFFAVADPGWITGQSYMISASLVTRTTSVLMEGSPILPDPRRFARIIERHRVGVFKAGSTFLKAVAKDRHALESIREHDLSSLRVATFCAEPTSPAIQAIGMDHVTRNYINSYWATEHGGIVLSHFFGSADYELRPDTHAHPMPWVFSDVWVADGQGSDELGRSPARKAEDGETGEIVITRAYPYLARTIWGNPEALSDFGHWQGDIEKFKKTYFSRWSAVPGSAQEAAGLPGAFTLGDFACRYADGSFTLHGRSDDAIKTSGHRIGTEEIEGAILLDKWKRPDSPIGNVIVIGFPDPVRGSVPLACVITTGGRGLTGEDKVRLSSLVRSERGDSAVPVDYVELKEFPETRSGKYLRRLISQILEGKLVSASDTSTLRNPECLAELSAVLTDWRKRRALGNEVRQASLSHAKFNAADLQQQSAVEVAGRIRRLLFELMASAVAEKTGVFDPERFQDSTVILREGLGSLDLIRFQSLVKQSLSPLGLEGLGGSFVFKFVTLGELAEWLQAQVARALGASGSSGNPVDQELESLLSELVNVMPEEELFQFLRTEIELAS